MAKSKKKGGSGQRVSRRHDNPESKEKTAAKKPIIKAEEKPRVQDRIQEKDAGFGVIKGVLVAIVLLIIGATALSRLSGSDELSRGHNGQDDSCEGTQECKKGFVCHSFRGKDAHRCMKLCTPDAKDCDIGYTCVSDAKAGRKKTRVRTVCAKDAKL